MLSPSRLEGGLGLKPPPGRKPAPAAIFSGYGGHSEGKAPSAAGPSDSVKVALRVRPLNRAEHSKDRGSKCIKADPDECSITVVDGRSYRFDFVFDDASAQHEVYSVTSRPLLNHFLDGFNCSILAYGQTGSGKTYTMGTDVDVLANDNASKVGILPRLASDLFSCLDASGPGDADVDFKYSVQCQFLEVYNNEIRDLFGGRHEASGSDGKKKAAKTANMVSLRDSGKDIVVSGAQRQTVESLEDLMEVFQRGCNSRTVASTQMNMKSSRSHAIFTLYLEQRRTPAGGKPNVTKSKFHLVDLAGSERQRKTGASGERFAESKSINMGLLALGNVISALGDSRKKGSHVPYRQSQITRLLQDSLGGNSQSLVIACCSPHQGNCDETLNTLKYASRARNIKNTPIKVEGLSRAEVSKLQRALERMVLETLAGGSPADAPEEVISRLDPESLFAAMVMMAQNMRDEAQEAQAAAVEAASAAANASPTYDDRAHPGAAAGPAAAAATEPHVCARCQLPEADSAELAELAGERLAAAASKAAAAVGASRKRRAPCSDAGVQCELVREAPAAVHSSVAAVAAALGLPAEGRGAGEPAASPSEHPGWSPFAGRALGGAGESPHVHSPPPPRAGTVDMHDMHMDSNLSAVERLASCLRDDSDEAAATPTRVHVDAQLGAAGAAGPSLTAAGSSLDDGSSFWRQHTHGPAGGAADAAVSMEIDAQMALHDVGHEQHARPRRRSELVGAAAAPGLPGPSQRRGWLRPWGDAAADGPPSPSGALDGLPMDGPLSPVAPLSPAAASGWMTDEVDAEDHESSGSKEHLKAMANSLLVLKNEHATLQRCIQSTSSVLRSIVNALVRSPESKAAVILQLQTVCDKLDSLYSWSSAGAERVQRQLTDPELMSVTETDPLGLGMTSMGMASIRGAQPEDGFGGAPGEDDEDNSHRPIFGCFPPRGQAERKRAYSGHTFQSFGATWRSIRQKLKWGRSARVTDAISRSNNSSDKSMSNSEQTAYAYDVPALDDMTHSPLAKKSRSTGAAAFAPGGPSGGPSGPGRGASAGDMDWQRPAPQPISESLSQSLTHSPVWQPPGQSVELELGGEHSTMSPAESASVMLRNLAHQVQQLDTDVPGAQRPSGGGSGAQNNFEFAVAQPGEQNDPDVMQSVFGT